MQRIVTHLWFDKEARRAAELYAATFPDSRITSGSTLDDTPSGSVEMVSFELMGREFQAISAGPEFKINPSVSFQVTCATKDEVDRLWAALADGATPLMVLGEYPFSERFGWLQDRYGVSWQLLYAGEGERPKLTPFIMFVGDLAGRAEEAIEFWTSVFENSRTGEIQRYGPGQEPDKPGTVMLAAFRLLGQDFLAMDSAHDHRFAFNEAISFMVFCDTQEEIDYYWSKLSADPSAEQCGWLKDEYGFSWQIVPNALGELMGGGDPAASGRVTQAFLQMKKMDIAALEAAYRGR